MISWTNPDLRAQHSIEDPFNLAACCHLWKCTSNCQLSCYCHLRSGEINQGNVYQKLDYTYPANYLHLKIYILRCIFPWVYWKSLSLLLVMSWLRRLTHWGRVTHICISKLGHHWFRSWYFAWPAPSHYLNQCWNIVGWTLGNKFHWNLIKRYNNISFKKIHLEMSFGKWRPFCLDLNVMC